MIVSINTTSDISKLSRLVKLRITKLTPREITYNNFDLSLVVFMPNITTNHAITYTNFAPELRSNFSSDVLTSSLVNDSSKKMQAAEFVETRASNR